MRKERRVKERGERKEREEKERGDERKKREGRRSRSDHLYLFSSKCGCAEGEIKNEVFWG